MRKFYEKRPVLVAVLWIVLYCVVMAPIKGEYGYASPRMLLALAALAAAITVFVKVNGLAKRLGMARWPRDTRRLLYLLPMWVLATANLWDGLAPSYRGAALAVATASMLLVGYVEEALFRGFLFRGMLAEGKAVTAVVVSALTFGMGHIVNLFAGQASFETLVQIFFAVAWGFIFTMVAWKSGSLLPCVVAHGMIDAFSLYGADNMLLDSIVIALTIAVGAAYSVFLSRQKTPGAEG